MSSKKERKIIMSLSQYNLLYEVREDFLNRGMELPTRVRTKLTKAGLDPDYIQERFICK